MVLGRANLKPSQSKLSPNLKDKNIRGDLSGLKIIMRHNYYKITIYGRVPTKMQRRLRLGAPGDTSFILNASLETGVTRRISIMCPSGSRFPCNCRSLFETEEDKGGHYTRRTDAPESDCGHF